MISDVAEMAVWSQREFRKDKIFVLGHSYGSFLGLQFALLTQNGSTPISVFANPSRILIEGRHDWNVNSDIAADWFQKVKAAEKHLIWFEHSAHMPMTEEPGNYCCH